MIAHASAGTHLLGAVMACALGAGYAWCWYRSGGRHPLRLAAWAGGLVVVLLVTTPWVEAWAAESFTAHMVQHLAFVVIVAPLLAIARPVTTAGAALRIARHRRSGVADLSAPTAAAVVVATFALIHFSGWYDAALRVQWIHEAEHLAFIVASTWLWAAVLASAHRRGPLRVIAVFATITGLSLIGMVLLAGTVPISDEHAARLGVEGAVADQRTGATLMWVTGMAVTVPLLFAAVWRWASTEERIAAGRDRHP